ncbi:MAG: Holliday junction branch migration protein RuvA [Paludibacteraceae bacterium]|nr:Holliday junction branch migration protein RuvA [Paludibacteraceae bacterium]
MIDYIKGEISELSPTAAVIEAAGVGYEINIALPVFTELQDKKEAKLYVEEIIREDTHDLYGFMNKGERELFRLLTSVSGIGANTARLMMSGFSAGELRQVIATGNVRALSQIKGLGAKTAQRVIVDLKDKVLKIEVNSDAVSDMAASVAVDSETKQEAVSALTMLGFSALASGKAVDKILADDPRKTVEQVIREALKML